VRDTFVKTLIELAESDARIMLLTADLGYSVLESFADRFPKRFFNVGVAEQNMVGVATGLAEAGYIPFVYSIATFASLRPYEFIRNGPILHNLPVRVVGVGGGFEYGSAGITHHALEDVAVMRTNPGMRVIVPADSGQTRNALLATWNLSGPVYYRLGKNEKAVVAGLNARFEVGKVQAIGSGKDVLVVAMGAVASEVAAAVADLENKGIAATLLVAASINPAPDDDLAAWLARFRQVVTVEEHYIAGGLGSLVSEVAAQQGLACRVTRVGVDRPAEGVSGSQQFMQDRYGLSRDQLVKRISALVKK